MPIDIGTLDGLTDYKVMTAIKNLAAAVEVLQRRPVDSNAQAVADLRQQVAALSATVAQLQAQVRSLL